MAAERTARIRRVRPDGTVHWRPALPRRTRLRLAVTRRIDMTCGWLVEHRLHGTAILIWRACGLW
jgi:hypothetical protein